MKFRVLHRCTTGRARIGELVTAHGKFETPVFMPVGTQATVKALSPDDVRKIGLRILLANTYHLYLRPGHLVIEKLGGLHRFMNWDGSILTDSGGYQVYSLATLRQITQEGVTFQSHLDGSRHFIGPKEAMDIQQALGSDIMMAFDECTPYPAEYAYVEESTARTSLWAARCLEQKAENRQALFGIVQGGMYRDLREKSARELVAMDFDGYALGGLAVGEDLETRLEVIRHTVPFLPLEKPVYLMGVGTPEDILEAAMLGVDMFDCVMPTRNARNGTLFTEKGTLVIKNARFREDNRPVEASCGCYTCTHFSRAYLRHLFMAREILAYRLNSIHNLAYYSRLMDGLRNAIREDRLDAFRREFYQRREEDRGRSTLDTGSQRAM